MFTITYLQPYSWSWKTESFNTLQEANRMIDFYKSCGTPAKLV